MTVTNLVTGEQRDGLSASSVPGISRGRAHNDRQGAGRGDAPPGGGRRAGVPQDDEGAWRSRRWRSRREQITEQIYALDVDRTKAGKKRWKRTGLLRRAERVETPDAYTVKLVNDASYALYRHEAGKPGRRKINPLRVAHWRDELVATFRPILLTPTDSPSETS
jgi:hypothetical protein